jgi:hypothetical protein
MTTSPPRDGWACGKQGGVIQSTSQTTLQIQSHSHNETLLSKNNITTTLPPSSRPPSGSTLLPDILEWIIVQRLFRTPSAGARPAESPEPGIQDRSC